MQSKSSNTENLHAQICQGQNSGASSDLTDFEVEILHYQLSSVQVEQNNSSSGQYIIKPLASFNYSSLKEEEEEEEEEEPQTNIELIKKYNLESEITVDRLNKISKRIPYNVFSLIINEIHKSNKTEQRKKSKILIDYLKELEIIILSDKDKVRALKNIKVDICFRHTYSSSRSKISFVNKIITTLLKKNLIEIKKEDLYDLEKEIILINESEYLKIKEKTKIKKITKKNKTQDEIFSETLNECCPKEISTAILNHTNTFKVKKHHINPINDFLKIVHKADTKWYEKPNVIQGELLKYRDELLNKFHRNTAYGKFQNLKNAISVLIQNGLLPSETYLPENLRRCTNTEKIRKDNPVLSNIDIYKEDKFIDIPKTINKLEEEISNNLSLLTEQSREIIYAGYKKYLSCNDAVQNSDFIYGTLTTKTNKSKINPFAYYCENRMNNVIAFYNHNYESILKRDELDQNLALSDDMAGHLGLTTKVATAMQIIITEELGINPYSLYRIKVTSDGTGLEYVLEDESGSVRLKSLKPRARSVQKRVAKGNKKQLKDIQIEDIDASVCLKMALEMTARARLVMGVNDLWTCISRKGLTTSNIAAFQSNFQAIRESLSDKSPILSTATLKKIRTSKGLKIFLNTNGNSLETARYFGNTVKTTLNQYIPSYFKEIIFRLKIRNFQRVLLILSTHDSSISEDILSMTEKELIDEIKIIFKSSETKNGIFENLKNENKPTDNLYFIVSKRNIKLALRYAVILPFLT